MFKCNDCGKVFDEPKIIEEPHPYGEGYAIESLAYCPYCNGGFGEAYPCKDCEEYFFKDELHSFYCTDCLKENWDKVDDLFEFAKSTTNENQINAFALSMFGGIEGVNDVLRLLLLSIFSCNPQMLKNKKEEFIEFFADELAEFLEERENEQSKIL